MEKDDAVKTTIIEKGHWNNRTEFMFALIGSLIGFGNMSRFPKLAYYHGGAVFLIPYITLMIFVGVPLYMMELLLGQYSGQGVISVWNMVPAFKGIGVSMTIQTILGSIYMSFTLSHTLFYIYASTKSVLPWTQCKEEWIPKKCYSPSSKLNFPLCNGSFVNMSSCRCSMNYEYDFNLNHSCFLARKNLYTNITYEWFTQQTRRPECESMTICTNKIINPSLLYYNLAVLKLSDNPQLGKPIWYLAYCLLFSWIITCSCILKGITTMSKVYYPTVIFPYFVMVVLMFEVMTLPGSLNGIQFYFVPDWSKLVTVHVWTQAANQVLWTLSISFGGLHMLSSYNRFNEHVIRIGLVVVVIDTMTSLLAGFIVFGIIGGEAMESNQKIDAVITEVSDNIAFYTYPPILASIPPSNLWSILFFLMYFMLGLTIQITFVETIVTAIVDEFQHLRPHKSIISVISSLCGFLISLPFICPGGLRWYKIMMIHVRDLFPIVLGLLELMCVGMIFNVSRFITEIQKMHKKPLVGKMYWMITWIVVTPVTLLILFINLVKQSENDMVNIVAWLFFVCVISPVPIIFIVTIVRSHGATRFEKLRNALKPNYKWGPQPFEETDNLVTPKMEYSSCPDYSEEVSNPHSYESNKVQYHDKIFDKESVIHEKPLVNAFKLPSVMSVNRPQLSPMQSFINPIKARLPGSSRQSQSSVKEKVLDILIKASARCKSNSVRPVSSDSSEYHMTPDPLRQLDDALFQLHHGHQGDEEEQRDEENNNEWLVKSGKRSLDTENDIKAVIRKLPSLLSDIDEVSGGSDEKRIGKDVRNDGFQNVLLENSIAELLNNGSPPSHAPDLKHGDRERPATGLYGNEPRFVSRSCDSGLNTDKSGSCANEACSYTDNPYKVCSYTESCSASTSTNEDSNLENRRTSYLSLMARRISAQFNVISDLSFISDGNPAEKRGLQIMTHDDINRHLQNRFPRVSCNEVASNDDRYDGNTEFGMANISRPRREHGSTSSVCAESSSVQSHRGDRGALLKSTTLKQIVKKPDSTDGIVKKQNSTDGKVHSEVSQIGENGVKDDVFKIAGRTNYDFNMTPCPLKKLEEARSGNNARQAIRSPKDEVSSPKYEQKVVPNEVINYAMNKSQTLNHVLSTQTSPRFIKGAICFRHHIKHCNNKHCTSQH